VRDLRSLIARREKMVRLSTMAKNRLHSMLHRHHLVTPEKPFALDQRTWWEGLPLSANEQLLVRSDLDTLDFAQKQVEQIEACLKQESAEDARIPLLIQLPGVAMLTAITILAAIGDITRFPTAKKLVGYAGLGTRVHDSGMTHSSGRITKAGRKDLRCAMENAPTMPWSTISIGKWSWKGWNLTWADPRPLWRSLASSLWQSGMCSAKKWRTVLQTRVT
jgi:transposase